MYEEPEEVVVSRLIIEYEDQIKHTGDIGPDRMEELDQLRVYHQFLLQSHSTQDVTGANFNKKPP